LNGDLWRLPKLASHQSEHPAHGLFPQQKADGINAIEEEIRLVQEISYTLTDKDKG